MKDRAWTISDLLAHRDGEPVDADRADAIARDAEADAALARLTALRDGLRNLAEVEVDDGVWLGARREVPPPPARSWTLRYPVATAASVFLASTLFIVMLLADFGAGGSTGSALPTAQGPVIQSDTRDLRLAGLMNRSRNLELRLRGGVYPALSAASWAEEPGDTTFSPSREEAQLLYRIADVDAQIARLYESRVVDHFAREQLWQRRVNLLENLVLLHGIENKRQL